MKKLSLMMMILLLASAFATLPALASSRPAPQQPQMSDEERKLSEEFYNAAYKEKNLEKAYPLAKQILEKYPNGQYAKYADQVVTQYLGQKFQTALKSFYDSADAAKLDQMIASGEEFLKKLPDQVYVITHLALATGRGSLGQFYKDMDKSKMYAEKALKLLDNSTPPQGYNADEYKTLRLTGQSNLNQYLGFYTLQQGAGDPDQAIAYLTKAAEMKDATTAKDPNTYWLRASAYYKIYEKLRAQHDALPKEQKDGDAGKALLAKIDPVVDKMVDDYARVVALTHGKAEAKQMYDAAKESAETFWKYRHDNKLDGLEALIKRYEADPTAAPPPTTPTTPTTPTNQQNSGTKPAPAARPRGK